MVDHTKTELNQYDRKYLAIAMHGTKLVETKLDDDGNVTEYVIGDAFDKQYHTDVTISADGELIKGRDFHLICRATDTIEDLKRQLIAATDDRK